MTQWIPQPSFGKGEISPSLYGRIDLAAYGIGASRIENFLVTRAGGLVNTAGTRFIGEVKNSNKKAILRKFSFNTQQEYLLEFGEYYMRVIKDGGYVVYDSGPDAGDIFELVTPYREEDLPLLKFVQSADVLTINNPAHPTYDLIRLDHDEWTLSVATTGVTMPSPSGVTATRVGSASTAQSYSYVVTAVNGETGEESLPSSPVSVSNESNLSQTVYNRINWNLITQLGVARGSFVISSSGAGSVRGQASGSVHSEAKSPILYVNNVEIGRAIGYSLSQLVSNINSGGSGYTVSLGAVVSGMQTLTITAPEGVQYNGRSVAIAYILYPSVRQPYTLGTISGAADPTHSGSVTDVKVNAVSVMSSSVAWAGSPEQTAFNVASRITSSGLGYTATSIGSTVYIDAPSSAGATPNGYAVTATKSGTIVVSGFEAMAGGGGTAVGGASSYNVYKERNGVYGFIGKSSSNQFEDRNILADVSDTPQQARNPFSNNNNPYCATYYDQRKVFARAGQVLDFSQSGGYRNFNVSEPRRDDDAMTRQIAARKVNEIRHLIPIRELLVLTSGGIWKIAAGSSGDAITPSNMTVRLQSEIGVSHVEPIVVGDIVLYVQDKGSILRDMGYSFQADNYVGSDLSLFSNHLFEGRQITSMAYAAIPNSIVYAVLDNGSMATLTYMREQEMIAWTRQTTDGYFESVASVSEGNEDAVYVIVRREINGVTKRYVERFETRSISDPSEAFFVHCGLSYVGEPVSTLTGLGHLEGREVAILCDGSVLTRQVVESGQITLPVAGSVIHVGLPYVSTLITLPVGDTAGGVARRKRVVKIRARLERSRGMWAGPNESDMTELKRDAEWTNNLPTEEVELLIVPENSEVARVVIQQRDPLPLSIQSIFCEVDS